MNQQRENLIITGSSGLIGSALIERLGDHYTIFGFDREQSPPPPPTAERVIADLTSDESLDQAFHQIRARGVKRIASVIHLAAFYDFSGEESSLYDEVTVRGTERILTRLRDFEVDQFVFSSTMLVHAPTEPGEPIDADAPLEPKWPYPQSKVETERLIREQRGDIPVVLLRIAGVYDEECHSVPLAQQIQRIHERQMTSYLFPGDTSHGQAFLHLDDLVDAFGRLIERRKHLPNELELVLGEPDTLSYDELQDRLGELIHGQEWTTIEIPKPVAKVGAWVQDTVPVGDEPFIKPWMIDMADDHYELEISRVRDLLGWSPRRSLRDTLPEMVRCLQADPDRFYEINGLDGGE
jgi:nucleoside-diphosphate-sugar epimerase